VSGAIIVTTPQDVSLKIARRGLRMFETVHVPIRRPSLGAPAPARLASSSSSWPSANVVFPFSSC